MGNYNNLLIHPPVNFNPNKHEFESTYVQRVK